MKKFEYTRLAALLIGGAALLPGQGQAQRATFEKDSVYLFAYASVKDEGRSGLRMAWSHDAKQWFSIGEGMGFVKCDYAQWGAEKRMFRPVLYRTADGWNAVWQLNPAGKELAIAATRNLTDWRAQQYFPVEQRADFIAPGWTRGKEMSVVVNERQETGTLLRAAWEEVEHLQHFAGWQAYRAQKHGELMKDDAVRFAGLSSVSQTLRIHPDEAKPISDKLFGVFFEDINYAADGGLYAELVQNRDFEDSAADRSHWNAQTAWKVSGEGTLTIATEAPVHPHNPHYARLEVQAAGASLLNEGYDGICVRKGELYDGSFFIRAPRPSGAATSIINKVKVSLLAADGTELCSRVVRVGTSDWRKQTWSLAPVADADSATLLITPQGRGVVELDMVSLFPRHTFRGHKNGLRADLAEAIADLRPRFVRFPGGCVAHGNGLDNIYRWKNTVGPLEARQPMRNLWGYHQSMGLGFYEYFRFCEDMGAEPLPVLAAGVTCQNTPTCPGEPFSGGQQGGIPLEQMDEYVQDVLDLIEYANGDPRIHPWAKLRAEAGHPQPFGLKYIGIGNEDLITPLFRERFLLIYRAVKAKYPDIQVVGTVGPFYEGSDYEEGWKLAEETGVDLVDEHYYNSPGWFIYNQEFYDKYPRDRKTKVYLGEYASHVPGRANNLETALSEALYLTAVERNGDVVAMTSYAPLLAKERHTQWRPDLIYFNNREVKPTVGYQVQRLFGQHSGDRYLPATRELSTRRKEVMARVGSSVVHDTKTGRLIVKLANLLPVPVRTKVHWPGLQACEATSTVLQGRPDEETVLPQTSRLPVDETFELTLPAYSFQVVEVQL